MKLPPIIIDMLARRAGHELRLPADCEHLALDIQSRTGEHVGATTLKRLLGFAADERMPHATTLDIVARYLGYSHWQQLQQMADEQGNSGFDATDGELRSASLSPGAQLAIAYPPDRSLRLTYLGNDRYHVDQSRNSKLCQGDELAVAAFILHHPMLATAVWRNGRLLGPFTAGRIAGLTQIQILSDEA